MLSKPFLAMCSNRSSLPKSHPTSGSPELWFSNERLHENGLKGIAFDFFVDWGIIPNALTPIVWIKRFLQPQFTYAQLVQNIGIELKAEFGDSYLNSLKSFAIKYGLEVQIIIFREAIYFCATCCSTSGKCRMSFSYRSTALR